MQMALLALIVTLVASGCGARGDEDDTGSNDARASQCLTLPSNGEEICVDDPQALDFVNAHEECVAAESEDTCWQRVVLSSFPSCRATGLNARQCFEGFQAMKVFVLARRQPDLDIQYAYEVALYEKSESQGTSSPTSTTYAATELSVDPDECVTLETEDVKGAITRVARYAAAR